MFPLKVLVINKSKHTHYKSVIAHSRLSSYSLALMPCFWPIFVDFQKETASLRVNNSNNKELK